MGMLSAQGKERAKEMESQRLGFMLDSLCGLQEKTKTKTRGKRETKDTIVVMDETVDPTRKPTDEELEEYMRWLGMDLKEHAHLRWIAHLGLTSKIEDEWKPCKIVESGQIFYFNFSTGESIWDHPVDVRCKAMFENYQKTHVTGFRFPDPGDVVKSTPMEGAGTWRIDLAQTTSGCAL
jgi:centrosomal protein CEP164